MDLTFTTWLDFVSRFIIAALLIIAGLSKIKNPKSTAETIENFEIVPKKNSYTLGVFLSITEMTSGLGILITEAIPLASIISSLLFLVFILALSYAIRKDKSIVCGCFGDSSREQVSWLTVYRSAFLLTASTIVFLLHINNDNLHVFNSNFSMSLAILGAISAVIGLTLSLGVISVEKDSPFREAPLNVSRRDFLKFLGAIALSLALLPVKPALAICCKCQEYRHYDPGCCTGNLYHVRHYFKRCCNPCTGQIGGWNHYRVNGCQCSCETHVSLCGDKIFACTGNPCWPGQCGCAV